MQKDLTDMCDERVKKETSDIEDAKDAEIYEITNACKTQCNEQLNIVNQSSAIECKKGQDQLQSALVAKCLENTEQMKE
jgi:hypothetical protein